MTFRCGKHGHAHPPDHGTANRVKVAAKVLRNTNNYSVIIVTYVADAIWS